VTCETNRGIIGCHSKAFYESICLFVDRDHLNTKDFLARHSVTNKSDPPEMAGEPHGSLVPGLHHVMSDSTRSCTGTSCERSDDKRIKVDAAAVVFISGPDKPSSNGPIQ
jgi:hypothetical protein